MSSPAISSSSAATPAAAAPQETKVSGKTISVISGPLPDGMPAYADFNDPRVCVSILDPKFQNGIDAPKAVEVALRVYQVSSREIAHATYEYSLNAEIHVWATKQAKGAVVAELAAGTGENGILLGYAGAKLVLLNDIEPKEAARFEELKKRISPAVANITKFDTGDCFAFLKNQALISKVQLVLCRNLIHYFNGKKLTQFVQLLKNFLPEGGKAVLTANSVYQYGEKKEFFEEHREVSYFGTIYCVYTNRDTRVPTEIFRKFFPISEKAANELDCTSSTELRIYDREPGKSWVVDKEAYKQIPEEFKGPIKAAYETNKKAITALKNGSVRVMISHCRPLFNIQTLPAVFEKEGFKVVHTFATNNMGHLVTEGDLFKSHQPGVKHPSDTGQIGVIIQK